MWEAQNSPKPQEGAAPLENWVALSIKAERTPTLWPALPFLDTNTTQLHAPALRQLLWALFVLVPKANTYKNRGIFTKWRISPPHRSQYICLEGPFILLGGLWSQHGDQKIDSVLREIEDIEWRGAGVGGVGGGREVSSVRSQGRSDILNRRIFPRDTHESVSLEPPFPEI